MFNIFLGLHILAGTIGLIIGPIAMYATKRKGLHTKVGLVYFYLMALVCLSAIIMSIMHWSESSYLFFIAIFSFYFAFTGYRASKIRHQGWLKKHISGMLGSYVAMTTALLVVNISNIPGHTEVPHLLFWFLPTIIAAPLIRRVQKKY